MTERSKRVLVTGANGFVGSHLTEALLERGYQVRCVVRSTSDLTFIHNLPVEWAYTDLRDADKLPEICDGIDLVCHCAALTRALDEATFVAVNATGTERLARACLAANPSLERFLYVSSAAAAGPSRDPEDYIDESRPLQPVTWYGKSKAAAEQRLRALNGRLPLTIVRPAAVFGPRDRDFFAYFEMVRYGFSLRLGRAMRLYSLIYVHDLIDLIIGALESGSAEDEIFFASSYAHSYTELADGIGQAMGKKPLRITLPLAVLGPISLWSRLQARVTGKPALLNDQRIIDLRQPYWLCSGEKARRQLGFAPQYDLAPALAATADWYRRNEWI
jgi:nucleoside-diphosphate-sugar epimerase